jgi:hypothetical protein
MQRWACAWLLLLSNWVAAQPLEQLQLLNERPVAGMHGGNLSGLAWCDNALWAVSDRDDQQVFALKEQGELFQAQGEAFVAPAPIDMGLPWGLRIRSWLAGMARGGELDFEGISCDAAGNRYLLSESHAAVLQLPVVGEPNWLKLPQSLVRQARARGMLLQHNSLLEGLAINPQGDRLYLAAERLQRGLLVVHKEQSSWRCSGGCVLLSEGGNESGPPNWPGSVQPKDFSDVALYGDKLFTLERQAHQICRRSPEHGQVEHCWSFAEAALTPERLYPPNYGMAEALWVDKNGAWIGVDNGSYRRADGEQRPIVWRFAAPAGGWSANP